jgi:hypothetical protein
VYPFIIALGLLQVPVTNPSGQAQPFVPGEVLIHFAPGTRGQRLVEQSGEAPGLDALTGPVGDLGDQVNVPLRPVRVNGGGWLLVRVPLDALREQVARRLARCPRVTGAIPAASDSADSRVLLTFAGGSPEAEMLRSGGDGRGVDSLAAGLGHRIAMPLKGTVQGQRLLVEVDLGALTLQLVERLKARHEIESAQPNYKLQRLH